MKVVIVGGVAGGAAAAARLRRLQEDARIIMFERGEFISYANCGLPYYIGGIIDNKDLLLVQTAKAFSKRFNVDVRTFSNVVAIDRQKKEVVVEDLTKGETYRESYDCLILSPGASPIVPNIQGTELEGVYTLRTVPDAIAIREHIEKRGGRSAVVVGAGYIGLEVPEALRHQGLEVSIVEKAGHVLSTFDHEMSVILERKLRELGVNLFLGSAVDRITNADGRLCAHTTSANKVVTDIIVLCIGVSPEVELAKKAGLDIGERGIVVNEKMQTSDQSIFAIGDAVEVKDNVLGISRNVPLAGPAAKQAVCAANVISGIDDRYDGTVGTAVLKCFDLTAASVGANERQLKAAGVPYEKVYIFPFDHATYYPGAKQLSIKGLFDPSSGRLFGVQIVGENGVDKRIDVFALAIKNNITVEALAKADFAYAPPYGSAKDPVNILGMVALNHIRGISPLSHWDNLDRTQGIILDVRTEKEVAQKPVPADIHIPVDELRHRLSELPKDKHIFVFCHVGVRGHIATRILKGTGYSASNISGGYLSYRNFSDANLL